MVVIDATMLMLFIRPNVKVPGDEKGIPIDFPRERIDALIKRLEKGRTKIIIPTPVLSEALVRAGAIESQNIIEKIAKYAVFRIEPFDTRAAIEVAALTRGALDAGSKKAGSVATWAKLKYDRQIVAVAKVTQSTHIYSDDSDISAIARKAGIPVVRLVEFPLPPSAAQLEMELQRPSDDQISRQGHVKKP